MKIFDYFGGNLLCETELDRQPNLRDELNIAGPQGDIAIMVFAIRKEQQEILVAPKIGGVPPINISFADNQFTCDKCEMQFPIGMTEEKFLEWNSKEWDCGFDLTRTIQIIKLVSQEHKQLCDLIRPVVLAQEKPV